MALMLGLFIMVRPIMSITITASISQFERRLPELSKVNYPINFL